ncbi:hypothetical protein D3C81_2056580 [compost metagenome]
MAEVETPCIEVKNFCSTPVSPVLVSESVASSGVACALYDVASLSSEVAVRSCESRYELYTRRTSASVVPVPMNTLPY